MEEELIWNHRAMIEFLYEEYHLSYPNSTLRNRGGLGENVGRVDYDQKILYGIL